jgi:glycosyltransferase involved in cell wall biosynthesis
MLYQAGNLNSYITGSTSYQESLIEEFNKSNYRVDIIGKSKCKNKILRVIDLSLPFILNSRQIKLVIIHSFSTNAFFITVWLSFLCKLFGKKYIILTHGGDYPNRIKKSPNLVRFAFGGASEVFCPSHYLKFYFEKAGYKCLFIPNAVDLKIFPFYKREIFKPKLLWVRSFAQIYNPIMAVEVVNILKEKYPDIELVMVGGKKDESFNEVQKYINDNDLINNVKITGMLRQDEWAALSISSDIFINTTTIDNMPLSVLQAMSLGLPVFSTNVGGIEWLIEDNINGIKCKNRNPEDMANKILYFLENQSLLRDIVLKAHEIPVEYSWDKILPIWLNVLKRYNV